MDEFYSFRHSYDKSATEIKLGTHKCMHDLK